MLDRVSEGAVSPAISQPVQSASETSAVVRAVPIPTPTVQTDSNENAWFSIPAQALLGSDPGLALHIITHKTISESSGYRYASGERSMPLNVFRAMLHDPQGGPWLAVLMDGCTAPWWLAMQRDIKLAAVAQRFKAEIDLVE